MVRCVDYRSFGVIRICGLSQPDRKSVGLQGVSYVGNSLGRFAKRYGKNPGRRWIQRTRMPGLFRIKCSTDLVHDSG